MATGRWEVFTTGRVLQYVTVGILENAGKSNLPKALRLTLRSSKSSRRVRRKVLTCGLRTNLRGGTSTGRTSSCSRHVHHGLSSSRRCDHDCRFSRTCEIDKSEYLVCPHWNDVCARHYLCDWDTLRRRYVLIPSLPALAAPPLTSED